MTETAKLLEPGFSTADAGYPGFALRDGLLVVDFVDWQEKPVRVRFSNAAGVKWQELDLAGVKHRDDSVYEILESSWLAEYRSQGAYTRDEGMRHFRLCFNAVGVLDVLAETMKQEDAG